MGTKQFKLPLMLLDLIWKYALIFILQKWNVEVWVITLYKAIYFAPQPLRLFKCCHFCKPIQLSLKISIRKSV